MASNTVANAARSNRLRISKSGGPTLPLSLVSEKSIHDMKTIARNASTDGTTGIASAPSGWLTWQDRLDNYTEVTGFPRSLFIAADGRVVGTWILGNSYKITSGLYGGYPPTYLRRIKALFPEKWHTLHLFSGKVDLSIFPGDTVDIDPQFKPTYFDDAQSLNMVPLERYDLVLADPPYSVEDAEHYGTTMIKRNKVMKALERLPLGAHVVWIDQVLPMFRKDNFIQEAVIGVVKSTNHRFRVVTIFRRR